MDEQVWSVLGSECEDTRQGLVGKAPDGHRRCISYANNRLRFLFQRQHLSRIPIHFLSAALAATVTNSSPSLSELTRRSPT